MIRAVTDEDRYQLTLLATPPGPARSGRTRYAAAVYFHGRGMISDETLEVFRICSPIDHENPLALLRSRKLDGELPTGMFETD